MARGMISRLFVCAALALLMLAGCAQPSSGDGELVRELDENGNPHYVRRKPASNQPKGNSPATNKPKGTEEEFCLLPPEALDIAATGLKVGAKAPGWTLKTLDGDKSISLSDFKGKTVMIEFWASWCPACRMANDENLKQLWEHNQTVADSNLVIIGVGLNLNGDTPAAQKAFAETKEYPWPLVFDEGAKVSDAYGVGVTPCVVVVSPDGSVETYGLYRRGFAKSVDEYLKQQCVARPAKK